MIAQYLDCACAMLSEQTFARLGGISCDRGGWPAMMIAQYDYGFVLSVPPESRVLEEANNLPEDLFCLLMYAAQHDCQLIRLDAAGDQLDGLPFYNW